MKLFICLNHDGYYPVGISSIIVAKNKKIAIQLLDRKLIENGLKPYKDHKYTLQELDLKHAKATILHNGDY